MRLTPSLCIWLVSTAATVLTIHGWFELRAEMASVERAARRELEVLAVSMRTSVECMYKKGGEPDFDAVLLPLESTDPELDVFVFRQNMTLVANTAGSARNIAPARSLVNAMSPDTELSLDDLIDAGFVYGLPIVLDGVPSGWLVLARQEAAMEEELRAKTRGLAFKVLLIVLTLSVTLSLVVHFRLRRPLRKIVQRVRNIADGDLSTRLDLFKKDEISELASEFDSMSKSLGEAKNVLFQQTESREQIQIEMQELNRLALVGQLASSVAREIGSPLQVIHEKACGLINTASLDDDARKNAEAIVGLCERVARTVERLLTMVPRKPMERRLIDLAEPIAKVVEIMRPHARRLGIGITFRAEATTKVFADSGLVQQVMISLLQNAIRASEPGNNIVVATAESSFTPNTSSEMQESVAIIVDDEGEGMDAKLIERAFDPLVTAWKRAVGGGTGLGLSVVKSIVSEHHGLVVVSLGPSGKGCRFMVHFPVGSSDCDNTVDS